MVALAALAVKEVPLTPTMAATAVGSIIYPPAHKFCCTLRKHDDSVEISRNTVYPNNYGHGPWERSALILVTSIKEKATVVIMPAQPGTIMQAHATLFTVIIESVVHSSQQVCE